MIGRCRPNLPEGRVKKLLIGEKYAIFSPKLQEFGVETLLLPEITEVDPRLSGHADLAVLTYNDDVFLGGTAGEKIEHELTKLGFNIRKKFNIDSSYPDDALLNACVFGKHIIHNSKFSPLSTHEGFIGVSQGYSKCNICVVRENAIITSDFGIAKAAAEQGIDVLRIESGHIDLPGFDTGFIGGCSFKLAPDLIAFTGNLDLHPNCCEIITFLEKYGVKSINLSNSRLLDIGSAVLLTEEI